MHSSDLKIYDAEISSFGVYPIAVYQNHRANDLRLGQPYSAVLMEGVIGTDGQVGRRRRTHIKSRAGCVNCKTRRIKVSPTLRVPRPLNAVCES